MQKGARAKFIADSGAGPALDLVLAQIHSDRVRTLIDPELAINFGGSVMVREHKGQFFPEGAYYRVEFALRHESTTAELQAFRWRGRVYVAATPEPLLAPMLRTVASVLVRRGEVSQFIVIRPTAQ